MYIFDFHEKQSTEKGGESGVFYLCGRAMENFGEQYEKK